MKIGRLPALVRTTTFRLALLHASIFILFSASLLAYLYYETAGQLGRQADDAQEAEVEDTAKETAWRDETFTTQGRTSARIHTCEQARDDLVLDFGFVVSR